MTTEPHPAAAKDLHKSNRIAQVALSIVLLGANLFAFNWLVADTPVFRFDLTEDREYSLTSVTRDLVSELDEELYLYGYFSSKNFNKLEPLIPEIRDMMEEYSVLSGGKIRVVFGDPREDESLEIEAKERFDVNPRPFQNVDKYEAGIVNAYFHIVVAYGDQYVRYNAEELVEVEVDPDNEGWRLRLRNLEYDLTKAIKKVLYGFQSVEALFADLEKDVEVISWISDAALLPQDSREIPGYLAEVCDELEEKGGDKFAYRAEPAPTDPAAQEALFREYGVRPFRTSFFETETFYCSAVLRFGGAVEPLYLVEQTSQAGVRESILSSIRRLAPGFVKTIGIHRPGPSIPPEIARQMGRPPERPDYELLTETVRRDQTVQQVDLSVPVDAQVDVLFVLGPEDLGEEEVFHIDQYLMRGGKVVLALDRYALDAENSRERLEIREIENPALSAWLAHMGIVAGEELLLDDRNTPFIIPVPRRVGGLTIEEYLDVDYPWFPRATQSSMADHPAVSRLESLYLYWPSALALDEERLGELEATRLVRSSNRSWTTRNRDVNPVMDDLTGGERFYDVPSDTESHTLAVTLTGSFDSYYTEHAPPGDVAPEDDEPDDGDSAESPDEEGAESGAEAEGGEADDGAEDDGAEEAAGRPGFLTRSPETRLAVIADAELFSERFAAMVRRPQPELESNLQFALNLVDWAIEDADMIRIRSRGATARPLELDDDTRTGWIEALNYAVPLAVILAIGIWQFLARRNRRPMELVGTSP